MNMSLTHDYLITLIQTELIIILNLYHFCSNNQYSVNVDSIEMIPNDCMMLFFQRCLDTKVKNYSISLNIFDKETMILTMTVILDSYITFTKDILVPSSDFICTRIEGNILHMYSPLSKDCTPISSHNITSVKETNGTNIFVGQLSNLRHHYKLPSFVIRGPDVRCRKLYDIDIKKTI